MLVVVYRWKHANPIQAYEVKVLADSNDIFHLSSTLKVCLDHTVASSGISWKMTRLISYGHCLLSACGLPLATP